MAASRVISGIAAAAAVVLSGCSGSSSAPVRTAATASATATPMSATAYKAALRHLAQQEDKAHHTVEQALQAHTVAQVRTALKAFAADQRRAAQETAALTPPADAATANARLAAAFRDNASALDALVAKLADAKSVKASLDVVQNDPGVQHAGQELDQALTALKKLGYASGQ